MPFSWIFLKGKGEYVYILNICTFPLSFASTAKMILAQKHIILSMDLKWNVHICPKSTNTIFEKKNDAS